MKRKSAKTKSDKSMYQIKDPCAKVFDIATENLNIEPFKEFVHYSPFWAVPRKKMK